MSSAKITEVYESETRRVKQLMDFCGELEAKLRKEREDSEKLMEAVVKGLLEGAATEKTGLDKLISL